MAKRRKNNKTQNTAANSGTCTVQSLVARLYEAIRTSDYSAFETIQRDAAAHEQQRQAGNVACTCGLCNTTGFYELVAGRRGFNLFASRRMQLWLDDLVAYVR